MRIGARCQPAVRHVRRRFAVSPWPLVPSSLDLRLLTVPPPEGRTLVEVLDPFVTLSDRGGYSRVLLAQVLGPGRRPVADVALKLQSDEYPLPVPGEEVLTANPDVVDGWEREVGALESATGPTRGLSRIVEVLDRAPGRPAHLPPLVFCKLRDAYFAAPCPTCGTTLADVRDDRWLDAHGLPPYESTASRFLACPSCRAGGGGRVWVLVREPEYDPGIVGDQGDLFHALGQLARRDVADDARVIPCQGCAEVDACFPPEGSNAGEAGHRLTPVTFYESEAIALEPFHFHWDEAMALVGGAPPEEVVARIAEPGRRGYVASVIDRLPPRHFLFAHDPEGKLHLERLRIKVGLVRQLCEGVAALHRRTRAPHLALSPETVLVRLTASDLGLPSWWTLSVGVFGVGNARRRVVGTAVGTDDDLVVYAVSPRQDPVYAPGAIVAAARDVPCSVTIERVVPIDDRDAALELAVQCEAVSAERVTDKDVVTVSIVQGRPPLTLSLAGTPSVDGDGRLRVRAPRVAIAGATRDAVAQLVGRPITRARLTHHPCRQAPVDVHALGMLLLVAVLADTDQPAADVARLVGECAARLDAEARAQDLDFGALTSRATRLVAERLDDGFDPRHVAWRPAAAAAEGLPRALWTDLLVIGLRAVTQIPGFSICRGWGDFDARHPEVKAEYLLQLVDAAVGRIDAVLFGLPGRVGTMRRVLRTVGRNLQPRSNVD